MDNLKTFETFLTNFSMHQQLQKDGQFGSYIQIDMSSSMALDPVVKRLCGIQGGAGKFLGVPIRVIPDTRITDLSGGKK